MTDPLRRATTATLGAILALALSAAGCDTNARFNINKRVFDKAVAVSAIPARQAADGSFVPQCGSGEVDGFLVNVALIGTEQKVGPGASDAQDKDRSIRPADIINTLDVDGSATDDIKLSGTTNLGLTLDCIDPLPDTDPLGCGGVPNAGLQISDIQYQEFARNRNVGHNVLILVDMSGSTKGWVNDGTFSEDHPNAALNLPSNLTVAASDFNSLRVAAVREFIGDLNADDDYGVIAFGEGLEGELVDVPCVLPEVADSAWDLKLDKCFGAANSEVWTRGLSGLQSAPPGRSTLWDALDKAYGWLKGRNQLTRTNHIVVVTDGPDTCAKSENFGSCQTPCATAIGYDDILQRLDADVGTPNVPQIQIHFVQFESPGYPGRDARQMEVACRTGGLYQHINSNELSKINEADFLKALRDALSSHVRFSLMGYWQMAVSAPVFQSNSGFPGGVPMGSVYGLQGQLTVKEASRLVSRDELFLFPDATSQWDTRLSVRKACGSKVDCGAAPDAPSDCTVVCSPETLTCPGGDQGVALPDTVACLESVGVCCGGACQQGAGATCDCN